MARPIDISKFPVMKARCKTFLFNNNGDPEIRNRVTARLMSVSQICHHPRLHDKKERHLCRGARDVQLQIFHRLGFLYTPTDQAWDAKRNQCPTKVNQ